MDDFLFDTNLDEAEARPTPAAPSTQKTASHRTDLFGTEDELLSAAELGYSIYSLHGNPQPLELMRVLGTLDNSFLAEKQKASIDSYYLSHLVDIFF